MTLTAKASDKLKVTFLNPAKPDNDFWNTVTSYMKAAGEDLGIDIRVHYTKSDSTDKGLMENYLALKKDIEDKKAPDYLLMIYVRGGSSDKIMKMANEAKIKTVIFNTDIPKEDREKIGHPRGKFPNWIGHMYPDDEKAGFDLANSLIKAARELKKEKEKVEVVGISGDYLSSAAHLRNIGLRSAVKENGEQLRRIIFADWSKDEATKKTEIMIKRYPNTRVFWSASDFMSLGIIDAIKKSGKTPGKDIVTGGVDWMSDALEEIRAGRMAASIGGHFMEAGSIMVMLYDYHNGKDFAKSEGVSIQSRMDIIDKNNVGDYLKNFKDRDWKKIDFKKLSKVLNPKLKKYDFSLNTILKQLNK